MVEKPIIILGAGATKACGGPLTDEILPAALNGQMEHDNTKTLVADREELLWLMKEFMSDCFNVPTDRQPIRSQDCPSLPMVLSMLKRSIDSNRPIGTWDGERLIKAKRAIEYAIFAVIEAALRYPSGRPLHRELLEPLYLRHLKPTVLSLNYDVIVDNEMFTLGEEFGNLYPPDYSLNIDTQQYNFFRDMGVSGRLLKIHGSLNWLYCEKCQRLDLFVSQGMRTGRGMRTAKALDELYFSVPHNDAYSCRGTPCRNRPTCDGFISPILITPTYFKDYENPHIEKVWQEAEWAMQEATRAVIIGYSLPTDDVDVSLLFKRGLSHLKRDRITVVEYVNGDINKPVSERTTVENHPTGQRFRSLFGDGLDWHTTGFGGWLDEQRTNQLFPFTSD
ncbi:MAG: hypothetical protein GC179_26865 [Anaerolineaceae bacterium]|nr:hypothetical protein [Anaerolineaceae bacterium]